MNVIACVVWSTRVLLGLRLGTAKPTSGGSRRKRVDVENWAVFESAPAAVRGQERLVDDGREGMQSKNADADRRGTRASDG